MAETEADKVESGSSRRNPIIAEFLGKTPILIVDTLRCVPVHSNLILWNGLGNVGASGKLSAAKVAKLKEPGRYGDGGGLWLHVGPSGGKSWVLRYMRAGRSREMGLGPLDLVGLAEAREKAREARRHILEGADPIDTRNAARDALKADTGASMTFRRAVEKYLDAHEAGWRNAKHRQQWRNTLATYVTPKIGSRPVGSIDPALINDTLAPIWKTKPETASRVRQRVERVVAWVRAGQPLPVPSKGKRVRHHPAMPYKALPAFMARLRTMPSISARALEFLILTATRTSETIGARRPEIDRKAKTWTIPAERMKAERDHRVPLCDRALEILDGLPREKGSDFIFPGGKAGRPLSNMALLQLMRGVSPEYVPHGFRSTFKDWAAETTSYPNIVSEAALAHTISDKVEAAYRRGELFEKRQAMMRDWEKYLAKVRYD